MLNVPFTRWPALYLEVARLSEGGAKCMADVMRFTDALNELRQDMLDMAARCGYPAVRTPEGVRVEAGRLAWEIFLTSSSLDAMAAAVLALRLPLAKGVA